MWKRIAALLVALVATCAPALATATVGDWGTAYSVSGLTVKATHVLGAGTACANGQKAILGLNVGNAGQTGFTIQNSDATASTWLGPVYFDSVAAGSEIFAFYYHECGASGELAGGYKITDQGTAGGTHSVILAFLSGAPLGPPCITAPLTTASAATSIMQNIGSCGSAPLTLAFFGNDATGEVFSTATSGWSSVTNNGAANNPGITLLQAAAGSLSVTATVTPTQDSLFSRGLQFGTATNLPVWIGG